MTMAAFLARDQHLTDDESKESETANVTILDGNIVPVDEELRAKTPLVSIAMVNEIFKALFGDFEDFSDPFLFKQRPALCSGVRRFSPPPMDFSMGSAPAVPKVIPFTLKVDCPGNLTVLSFSLKSTWEDVMTEVNALTPGKTRFQLGNAYVLVPAVEELKKYEDFCKHSSKVRYFANNSVSSVMWTVYAAFRGVKNMPSPPK